MATVDVASRRVRGRIFAPAPHRHRLGGGGGNRRSSAGRYALWHRRVVLAGDVVVALGCAAVAVILGQANAGQTLSVAGVVLAAVMCPLVFGLRGYYGRRFVGSHREIRHVVRTLGVVVGAVALVSALLDIGLAHQGLLVVSGGLLVGFVAVRRLAVRRMTALRRQGLGVTRTIAVGSAAEISRLVNQFAKATGHKYVVVGACVEDDGPLDHDVPLLADLADSSDEVDSLRDSRSVQAVVRAARKIGADTVCVAASSRFTGNRLRALGWALDQRHIAMVTALGVVGVADHRIRLGHAGGVALLEIESVHPNRVRRLVKGALDRLFGAILLVLCAPLLMVAAVLVWRSSPGPIIYRQSRAGRVGVPFTMVKFRTMYVGAHGRRDSLLAANDGAGPMFKVRDDPRITPIGRLLRKYSIDELPQLVNVVRGEMSLVGPRPPLLTEVEAYDAVERRRLRAAPGMTGLWQVSGRSNLSWDEAIELDLTYVDNWTIGGDLRLMGRTVSAVVSADGSY